MKTISLFIRFVSTNETTLKLLKKGFQTDKQTIVLLDGSRYLKGGLEIVWGIKYTWKCDEIFQISNTREVGVELLVD